MMKCYIDAAGKYLGIYDGAKAPDGAEEVPCVPSHGFDMWDREAKVWVPSGNYMAARAMAYPPLVDQIEALIKGGSDLDAMRDKIAAIKAKFPKARD